MKRGLAGLSAVFLCLLAVGCGMATVREKQNPTMAGAAFAMPSLGPKSAEVSLNEYFDFACGVCKKMVPTVKEVQGWYPDSLRVEFHPFQTGYYENPLKARQGPSFRAAAAYLAADRQGKAMAMKEALFETAPELSDDSIRAAAQTAGLDMVRFEGDWEDPAIVMAIEANRELARSLGFDQTPAFILAGQMFHGHLTARELANRVEKALIKGNQSEASPESVHREPVWSELVLPPEAVRAEPRLVDTHLKVGDPAPDFTLPAVGGGQVSLSDFRGMKVLLTFVPAAFTPVCSVEWPMLASMKSDLSNSDTVVIGITTDNVPALHAWTMGMQGLEFPVLSDFWPHGEVSRKYGVLRPDRGITERGLFLVDGEGVIRYIDIVDIGMMPNLSKALEAARALD